MKLSSKDKIQIIEVIVADNNLNIITNKGKITFVDTKQVSIFDIERLWEKTHKEKE